MRFGRIKLSSESIDRRPPIHIPLPIIPVGLLARITCCSLIIELLQHSTVALTRMRFGLTLTTYECLIRCSILARKSRHDVAEAAFVELSICAILPFESQCQAGYGCSGCWQAGLLCRFATGTREAPPGCGWPEPFASSIELLPDNARLRTKLIEAAGGYIEYQHN